MFRIGFQHNYKYQSRLCFWFRCMPRWSRIKSSIQGAFTKWNNICFVWGYMSNFNLKGLYISGFRCTPRWSAIKSTNQGPFKLESKIVCSGCTFLLLRMPVEDYIQPLALAEENIGSKTRRRDWPCPCTRAPSRYSLKTVRSPRVALPTSLRLTPPTRTRCATRMPPRRLVVVLVETFKS